MIADVYSAHKPNPPSIRATKRSAVSKKHKFEDITEATDMSAFITDLFQSIFTPGPTSTLLVATNVSFASLQVVLLLLLIATYSIHFLILSFLSAGLWWAINWFASELKASQALEEEKKRRMEEMAEDTETEVETVIETGDPGSREVEVHQQRGDLKDRGGEGSRSEAEASTEDEWERVSENEKDK